MNRKKITTELNSEAEKAIPDNLDLWPTIQTQLISSATRLRRFRYRPITRLARIALTIVALLMVSGVAYAISPILRQLFQTDPGLQHVEETDLVQPFHLSQTNADLTITVEQAYADSNRITIGYTLEAPEGRHYKPRKEKLTWLPDTDLPPTIGHGDGTGGYNLSFNTRAIEGNPRHLDLRLEMYAEEFIYPPEFKKLLDQYGSVEEIPEDQLVGLPALTRGNEVGPFIFNFSIPFLSYQTLSIEQTVEAAGARVQLVEIEIAPSQTQAILCVTPPAEGAGYVDWIPIITLTTGSGREVSGGGSQVISEKDQEICHQLFFPHPLADQPGEWTLTVTELVGFSHEDPDRQMRPAGPWVFKFTVPGEK